MFSTLLDINKFARSLTLRHYFFKPDNSNDNAMDMYGDECIPISQYNASLHSDVSSSLNMSLTGFKDLCNLNTLRSLQAESRNFNINPREKTFTPPNPHFYPINSRPNVLDIYHELVERDLVELHNKVKSNSDIGNDNLTRKERLAVKNLVENGNLVVKNADKGGAIIVLDAELYRLLNNLMLADDKMYVKLKNDPTNVYKEKLNLLLRWGVCEGILSKGVSEKIWIEHPVAPIFHSLPKIHKDIFPPPMRSIVAGIGSLGENLGAWLDHMLQPLVTEPPGFLRDTKQVIATLEGVTWNPGSAWLACDVVALYPSLPHDKMVAFLEVFLNQHSTYSE